MCRHLSLPATPRMTRILKWLGIGIAGLLALIVVAGVTLFLIGRSRAATAPHVAAKPVRVSSASGAIERGRHLAEAITPCGACHAPDLGGKPFPTPTMLISMAAPNLTRGEGGIGASYTLEDWERALRHGVGNDGRRLLIMPSEAYAHLDDGDLAALIAYLQSVPPVDRTFPARRVGPAGAAMIATGVMPVAVDMIDHDSVGNRVIEPAVSAEYGDYLVRIAGCQICHGANLNGEKKGPGPPPAPSLVAFVANNSADDFRKTMRTGVTPSGRVLDPEAMPWTFFGKMTDDELEAVRLHVLSVIAPERGDAR